MGILFKKKQNQISEEGYSYALSLSSKMTSEGLRRRAFIQILGVAKAVDFFIDKGYEPSTSTCLHRVTGLLQELQICDLMCQNYRLYTISVYKDKTIRIPKIHYDFEIIPDYYLIVHISETHKEAEIIGYVVPEDIQDEYSDDQYYYVSPKKVGAISELLRIFKRPKLDLEGVVGSHKDCIALFARYIDKELSGSYKKAMLQHLISCESCTARFIDLLEFDNLAKNASRYPQMTKKYAAKVFSSNASRVQTKDPKIMDEEQYPVIVKPLKAEGGNFQAQKFAPNEMEAFLDLKTGKQIKISKDKTRSIELMFSENGISDEYLDNNENRSSKPKISSKAVAIVLLSLVILMGLSIMIYKIHASYQLPEAPKELTLEDMPVEQNMGEAIDSQSEVTPYVDDLPPIQSSNTSQAGQLDSALSSAQIGQPNVAPTITKISWEVPTSVSSNSDFTKFLQMAGKNVKLNLQNDLLLTSDFAYNTKIVIDLKLLSRGGLGEIKVRSSSGSDQVDAVIMKSVRDTLAYIKPPAINVLVPSVTVTLIINL